MSKTTLLTFWVIWLLDVLIALFGYREFILGVFGRYAAPSGKYLVLWIALMGVALLITCGSLYFKKHGNMNTAITIAAIPLVIALPYALWLVMVVIMGRGANWH
jgi:hypothetical protein